MNRLIEIDPADAVPIWRQIEDGIAQLIASGALAPGSAVPSVRDFARELRINPATVQKGYQRLVESGHLTIRRGAGTFVSDSPPALARNERSRRLKELAGKYAVAAVNLGAAPSDAIEEVRGALARLARPASDGGKS